MKTLLTREQFHNDVLARDGNKCVVCEHPHDITAHHIIDRKCYHDGGYYEDNGITLCSTCHINAENGIYTCQELRIKAHINAIILPEEFNPVYSYDKWGNPLTDELIKYPRTRHIEGSGLSNDDEKEVTTFEELFGKYLVIECKMDGANSGISFNKDCDLLLQCRGHFLKGGRDWPEFDQFKVWANTWKDQIFDVLTDRYIMYGEWMGSFHSVFYDKLPHYFMEFDFWDKQQKCFLSTSKRKALLDSAEIPIHSVRVIKQGKFKDKNDILSAVGKSGFVSDNSVSVLKGLLKEKKIPEDDIDILMSLNNEQIMEGIYIKWEEDGVVRDRYKFVRPIFVETIKKYGKHWLDRPAVPNLLGDGADMFKYKEMDEKSSQIS